MISLNNGPCKAQTETGGWIKSGGYESGGWIKSGGRKVGMALTANVLFVITLVLFL